MATDLPIFKMRGPLNPDEDGAVLVARPELAQLLRHARAPQVDAYIALLSSRQTGKTTLLYQLCANLRAPGFATALIDLSSVQDQPEVQVYNYVARVMRQELLPGADSKDPLPATAVEFQNFMLEVARRLPAGRILVLLDEVEAVPAKLSDGFFGTFRSIFNTRHKERAFEKFLVVLSGAKELSRLTTGNNSPLNIAERFYLQDLTVAGVDKLVANFQPLGLTAPPETAAWIHTQTGGHPYLTQKLCAMIAEHTQTTITLDIVKHCARDLLHGDDHLEKMIADMGVESNLNAKNLLGRIVAGDKVQFSRLDPQIARLELSGAIRDDGLYCAVRNSIYDEAFQRLYNIGSRARTVRTTFMRAKPLVYLLMLTIIFINVPFMVTYVRDIALGAQRVTHVITPEGWGIYATMRHENILHPIVPVTVTVDVEQTQTVTPLAVRLYENDPRIVVTGDHTKTFTTTRRSEVFSFFLDENAIPYNPFQLTTPILRVDFIFQSQLPGRVPETHSAEFKVDYYSAFMRSVQVSIGGLIGLIATWVGNVQKIKTALGVLQKFFKMVPQ